MKRRKVIWIAGITIVLAGAVATLAWFSGRPRLQHKAMLWVLLRDEYPGEAPRWDYTIEVMANGHKLATLHHSRGASYVEERRVVFQPQGQTRFAFRMVAADGTVLCQPEFDRNVKDGDMIEFAWEPTVDCGKQFPQDIGPGPDAVFPCRVQRGRDKGVWCRFGHANASTECFGVTLKSGASWESFKDRCQRAGYTIRYSTSLVLPKPMSVVDGMLEIETWEEVKETHYSLAVIY